MVFPQRQKSVNDLLILADGSGRMIKTNVAVFGLI